MTIKIEVECDGWGCHATREIGDYTDGDVKRIGWGIDDETGFHYCPKCWPVVQEEMRGQSENG